MWLNKCLDLLFPDINFSTDSQTHKRTNIKLYKPPFCRLLAVVNVDGGQPLAVVNGRQGTSGTERQELPSSAYSVLSAPYWK